MIKISITKIILFSSSQDLSAASSHMLTVQQDDMHHTGERKASIIPYSAASPNKSEAQSKNIRSLRVHISPPITHPSTHFTKQVQKAYLRPKVPHDQVIVCTICHKLISVFA